VLWGLHDKPTLRRTFLFNAMTDIADAAFLTSVIIRTDDVDVAARRSLGLAVGGCPLWWVAWWWAGR
jgi:hypothetical protein